MMVHREQLDVRLDLVIEQMMRLYAKSGDINSCNDLLNFMENYNSNFSPKLDLHNIANTYAQRIHVHLHTNQKNYKDKWKDIGNIISMMDNKIIPKLEKFYLELFRIFESERIPENIHKIKKYYSEMRTNGLNIDHVHYKFIILSIIKIYSSEYTHSQIQQQCIQFLDEIFRDMINQEIRFISTDLSELSNKLMVFKRKLENNSKSWK